MNENPITYFARTNYRGEGKVFGIKRADRRSHMYIVGKSGTGKTTLLKTMILQDLERGEGIAVLDPHGDMVDEIVSRVPKERQGEVVYLNAPDPNQPHRFNPLADVPALKRPLAAAGLVEVFKKTWPDSWGPRLEHLLRNVAFALLETPGATLADIPRLLKDGEYRRRVAEHVSNSEVRSFWLSEYEGYSPSLRALVIAPLQNKVGAFLTDPLLHCILSAPRSTFSLRSLMDSGGVLLVNLAKGRMGEGPAALLGSLLVASLGLAALGRADVPEESRRDFFLYLDEFHTFSTLSLSSMLAELRKYRLGLVLAHQHLAQLTPRVQAAILGNVGTLISFRVGPLDAQLLAREFGPEVGVHDLTSIGNYEVFLKLMVDGVVSRGFSGRTVELKQSFGL